MSQLGGCRIDAGYRIDYRRAPDEVVRPLPRFAASRSPKVSPRIQLADGWPVLAGKASEPSRDASYPLSYLSWQGLAKSSAGSEQMASWFTGWVCDAGVMQALAGCSAFLRKESEKPTERGTIFLLWHRFHQSTVPGSHRALPGTQGGGTYDHLTAPTAWTAPTALYRR